MAGSTRHYYAGGNTALGFYSLYESNIKGLDRLFILKGGPGTGKSTLIKQIGDEWATKGYAIELLHCANDPHALDGVIIPKLKVGIVDGTTPHVLEPTAPGTIEEYVNLGVGWDREQLAEQKGAIVYLHKQVEQTYQSAYDAYAQALHIHDEWEEIFIKNMDFEKADELTDQLIQLFFADKQADKKAVVRHRFLGAATPNGPHDFIPNLTEDVTKRYFLKGRPGSGKSTLLKKIATAAEERGFDVEIYHGGFDPHSLDMVIVREVEIAIFDSTAPHEYFPERVNDNIVDMYENVITPGTDEKYATEIDVLQHQYSTKMKEGSQLLAQAKMMHDELETIYTNAMNFEKIEHIQQDIHAHISKIANSNAVR